MNKIETVLGVFAHPDDEFVISGLIQQMKKQDIKVVLVCATKGEAGNIRNEKVELLENSSVGSIRVDEYESSLKILNINNYYFLNQEDSKSDHWDIKAIEKQLFSIIKNENISVMISFDKAGINGHPDHIQISSIAKYIANKNSMNYLEVTKYSESFMKSLLWFLPNKIKVALLHAGSIKDEYVTGICKLKRSELKNKLQILKYIEANFQMKRTDTINNH